MCREGPGQKLTAGSAAATCQGNPGQCCEQQEPAATDCSRIHRPVYRPRPNLVETVQNSAVQPVADCRHPVQDLPEAGTQRREAHPDAMRSPEVQNDVFVPQP